MLWERENCLRGGPVSALGWSQCLSRIGLRGLLPRAAVRVEAGKGVAPRRGVPASLRLALH